MNIINFILRARKTSFERYQNIDGWLTGAEAKGLRSVAAKLDTGSTIVEIGSWKGKSTWCLGHGLKEGKIFCIDPFNAAGEEGSKELYEKTKGTKSLLKQFEDNLKDVHKGVQVLPRQGYSADFVGQFQNISFLFIDGDHSIEGCRFDFDNFQQAVKPGGFIAFHDYYPDRHDLGSTWVVDNLVKPSAQFELDGRHDSLIVFRKIS
jgi:predicted O-methyltransferase YrrM